jgi:hypothetical protein
VGYLGADAKPLYYFLSKVGYLRTVDRWVLRWMTYTLHFLDSFGKLYRLINECYHTLLLYIASHASSADPSDKNLSADIYLPC